MAGVEKFRHIDAAAQINHNSRAIPKPSNENIDLSISSKVNYSLHPIRGMADYDYYLKRKSEIYYYNRSDVITLMGWILTAPRTLEKERYPAFFQTSYDFICEMYGEKNIVQAVVHNDEVHPHLQVLIIPAVPDTKHDDFEEKFCCSALLTPQHMRNWHPKYKKYLSDHGIKADVYTGITREQGGNKTVKQLKQEEKERNKEWDTEWGAEWDAEWEAEEDIDWNI